MAEMRLWTDTQQVEPRSISKITWDGTGSRARLSWLGDGRGDDNNRLDQERQALSEVTSRRCIAPRKSFPGTSSRGAALRGQPVSLLNASMCLIE
jgi:hypothetical protein